MAEHYDDLGAGPTIVFSHGMLLDRSMFVPQLNELSPWFRTIAFDHRARRPEFQCRYDLYDLASDLTSLLDDRDVECCVLAGMSMGGFMAIRAAIRDPDRIAGVVLIGASDRPYTRDEQARWEAHYGRHRNASSLPRSFAEEEARSHFSTQTRRTRPDLVTTWTDRIASRDGKAAYLETLAWSRQDDVREAWAALEIPVLIIHGEEDAAVSIEDALDTFARARQARLLVVPYAGHAVNIEASGIVNEALRSFTTEVYSNRARR